MHRNSRLTPAVPTQPPCDRWARGGLRADTSFWMKWTIHLEIEFDDLLRHLAIVGIAAFAAWLCVGAMGYAAGYLQIAATPAIRFMVAILVLVLPTVIVPDLRRLRYRHLSLEERS